MIAAIDPGLGGAIALGHKAEGVTVVMDLPSLDGEINASLLVTMLGLYDIFEVVIEAQHTMGKNGTKANFVMGQTYGTILGVLASLRVPIHRVTPQAWKKASGLGNLAGLTDAERKERSRRLALDRYPTLAEHLARKMDHNRAEAMLILDYWLSQKSAPEAQKSRRKLTKVR